MMDGFLTAAGCPGWGGREARPALAASSLSRFALFLLNLSQKAHILPFWGCTWLSERSRCWWEDGGPQDPRATPSLGPSKALAPGTGSRAQRGETTPENSIYFQCYFLFFFFPIFSLYGILRSEGSIRPFPWLLSLWGEARCFPGTEE